MDFDNVSRTLDAINHQFAGVVIHPGRPPLDSEQNLSWQIADEALRKAVQSMMPSGFLSDPTRALDEYQFSPLWANRFLLGKPRELIGIHETLEQTAVTIANVNGWIIPVIGTDVGRGDNPIANVVKLYPPPTTGARIDFVFLEAWLAEVEANPSTVNKPSASTVWNYGNVKFGGTNLTDDLIDPAIGSSTAGRIQVQYRIRVYGQGESLGTTTDLSTYPDGLGDPGILGQGTGSLPVAGLSFQNMRTELGDPSLWRAGDGLSGNGLGTVDGYTYAIPICAIFRRNAAPYLAVNSGSAQPNQNGSFERTPHSRWMANPLDGSRVLLQASLGTQADPDIIPASTTLPLTVHVTNLNGCGLRTLTSPRNMFPFPAPSL